jgi:hypothetical protein
MSSFTLYLIGLVILIGIGIITAVSQTRRRDTPPSSQTDQT